MSDYFAERMNAQAERAKELGLTDRPRSRPRMIEHVDRSKGLSVSINGHDVSVDGPPPPTDWWCQSCLSGQCEGCDGTAYNVEEDVMTTCGHDHAVPYITREQS